MLRVLIVEDSPTDAALLQAALTEWGGQLEIDHVECMEQAEQRLKQGAPVDVVLLDLGLPDSTGLVTLERATAAAPRLPILVLTGREDDATGVEAVRKGAQDYLTKGQTTPRMLVRAIQHATERKRLEGELKAARDLAEGAKSAAEQANRVKDHFLAVLSHELRTPLTPVVMGVSMLQDRPDLDPQVRAMLEMVRRNVELEARLIDDLLDVSRIAQGKIQLRRTVTELCTVIDRAVEVCQPDIEARRLHFGVDRGPAAPYWVEADVSRLQQVFWNLLKNAIKFTPPGGCVGIRCRPHEEYVLVEVNDSGIGIEPEALTHIFNAFEQAERIHHTAVRRFGLGAVDQQGPRGDARRYHLGPQRGAGPGGDVLCPAAALRARRPAGMPRARHDPGAGRPRLAHPAHRGPRSHGVHDADGTGRGGTHGRDGRRRGHGTATGQPATLRPAPQRSRTAGR